MHKIFFDMKKLFFVFGLVLLNCFNLLAASGIFDNGIRIQVNNGTATQYFFGFKCTGGTGGCTGSNSSTAPNFDGASAGSGVYSLQITWAEVRTYKNGGDDITGTNLFYRVYPTAGSPGAFVQEGIAFGADNVGGSTGDQRWTENLAIELTTGLMTSTNYTLEIYSTASFTYTGGGGGSGTHFNNNSGSNFKMTFTTNSTFPVEMTRFDAKTMDKTVLLHWETATEHNNRYFEVQRSADSRNWEVLGQVPSWNGNSRELQSYQFTDEKPAAQTNYYRLRQVDTDGAYEFSKVVQASVNGPRTVSAMPNPVGSALQITLLTDAREAISRVEAFDASGLLLQTWNWDAADTSDQRMLDVSGLPAGALIFRINGTETQRVIKR